jgi:hypothetical protein
MTTLTQYIEKYDIQFEYHVVYSRPDGLMSESGQSHFRCRILRKPRAFSLYFSMGSAHTSPPTLADVLDCLASDASGYENSKDFESWASEYGYDADSRSAEKIYRAVKRQSEQLKRTVGDEAYQELLWETERL